jgi:hypothetical protein
MRAVHPNILISMDVQVTSLALPLCSHPVVQALNTARLSNRVFILR